MEFLYSSLELLYVVVGVLLLFGAAVSTRANWLRAQGIALPVSAAAIRPMEPAEIQKRIELSP